MTEHIAVEARRIVKSFGQGAAAPRALNDVSVLVRRGEFFTLLGPSGCGKTTLLRLIAGFEQPTSGTILLEGADITAMPPNKRPVNTVFQSYALFPHLTVAQNIGFGLERKGRPRAEVADTTARMLALVRMEEYAARRINQLSGGQQQRIALARALAPQPKVLLLDEPLSALDLKLRKEMQIELKRLQLETGITFIFVTHDQEEALTMSDRIGVMQAGHLLQTGTPREIYTRPANRFVAGFIGETNFLTGILRGTLVTLEGVGPVRLAADPGMPAGSKVTLAIRPEHVRIVPDNTAGCLPATIRAQVYFGTDTHCHLGLGATQVVARLQSNPSGDPGLAVGTRVGLIFTPGSVQVLAE